MIDVRELCKRFGAITAVDDVTFNVARGEVLGFLGPNGAGKSTTMKIITGFLAPDAGSVTIGGDDVHRRPVAAKRRIGYLPEGAPLYGDMTPRGFLQFAAALRGLDGDERTRRIGQVVERIELDSVLERPIDTLSKGFKRRVGLAQAMLHDPQVLVLDEPTDGLDPNQKHEVRALIRTMAPDKAIILSTHILEEVEAVCSRVLIIAGGRLVADGTPGSLQARSPLHNAVTLTVPAPAASEMPDALRALDTVSAVDILAGPSPEHARLRVLPVDGKPVLASVNQLIRTRQWPVEEVHVERGRLDEVFRGITRDAQVRT